MEHEPKVEDETVLKVVAKSRSFMPDKEHREDSLSPGGIKRNKWLLPVMLSLAAAVYILAVRRLGFGIPCIFHRVTGFKCPGCGITGLFVALSQFDLKAAFYSNRFIFATFPFLAAEFFYLAVLKLKGKKNPRWNEGLLSTYVVLLIVWGVVRNCLDY